MDFSDIFQRKYNEINMLAVQHGLLYCKSEKDYFDIAMRNSIDVALGICVKPELHADERYRYASQLLKLESEKTNEIVAILARQSKSLQCEGLGQALIEFAIYAKLNESALNNTGISVPYLCQEVSSMAIIPEYYQMTMLSNLRNTLENQSLSKSSFTRYMSITLRQNGDLSLNALKGCPSLLISPHLPDEVLQKALDASPRINSSGDIVYLNDEDLPLTHLTYMLENPNLSTRDLKRFFDIANEKPAEFNIGYISPIYSHCNFFEMLKESYGEQWCKILLKYPQAWDNQSMKFDVLSSLYQELIAQQRAGVRIIGNNSIDDLCNSYHLTLKRKVFKSLSDDSITAQDYLSMIERMVDFENQKGWDFNDSFDVRASDIKALLENDTHLTANQVKILTAKIVMLCFSPPSDMPPEFDPDDLDEDYELDLIHSFKMLLNAGVDLESANGYLTIKGILQTPMSFIESRVTASQAEMLIAAKLNHRAACMTTLNIVKAKPAL